MSTWGPITKKWDEYPRGTLARSPGANSWWVRTKQGWTSCTGILKDEPVGCGEVKIPSSYVEK